MSCPNLERGKVARCRALGGEGLGVESPEFEEICFSGEFSKCPFLSLPVWREKWKNIGSRNSSVWLSRAFEFGSRP